MNAHSSVQQHFTSSTGGNATFSWHVASPPWGAFEKQNAGETFLTSERTSPVTNRR